MIVYRDLKSENVLAWSLPSPAAASYSSSSDASQVLVKLADYGISRASLPSGTKGYAGTDGFMAPEIIRFNGEEAYTEKVDCFSFGVFIYELVSEGGMGDLATFYLIYILQLADLLVTSGIWQYEQYSFFPGNM